MAMYDQPENITTPGLRKYYAFERSVFNVTDKLFRLETGFASVGSGGGPVDASRNVRKSLQQMLVLYGRHLTREYSGEPIPIYNFPGCAEGLGTLRVHYATTFKSLADACGDYWEKLGRFIRVYYNDSLRIVLLEVKKHFTDFSLAIFKHMYSQDMPYDPTMDRDIVDMSFSCLESKLGELSKRLDELLQDGIPTIQHDQKKTADQYHNMTTVATFLTGVTATVLQYTFGNNRNSIDVAVNAFLFISIVFSVASAANSLLVVAWRRMLIRPPERALPSVLANCLTRGPTLYLTVSGVMFSLGTCSFAFSSTQHFVTCILVVLIAATHALMLIALTVCFIAEQWRFRNMAKIGKFLTEDSMTMSILEYMCFLRKRGDKCPERDAVDGDNYNAPQFWYESKLRAQEDHKEQRLYTFTPNHLWPSHAAKLPVTTPYTNCDKFMWVPAVEEIPHMPYLKKMPLPELRYPDSGCSFGPGPSSSSCRKGASCSGCTTSPDSLLVRRPLPVITRERSSSRSPKSPMVVVEDRPRYMAEPLPTVTVETANDEMNLGSHWSEDSHDEPVARVELLDEDGQSRSDSMQCQPAQSEYSGREYLAEPSLTTYPCPQEYTFSITEDVTNETIY